MGEHMPAWKAATYATGTTEAAMRALEQVRNDSATIVARQDAREASLNTRQDALDQRERQIGVMAAQVADMAGRMAVEWDKLQACADQEREAEDPLTLPPGTDEVAARSKEPEPSLELEGDTHPGDPTATRVSASSYSRRPTRIPRPRTAASPCGQTTNRRWLR